MSVMLLLLLTEVEGNCDGHRGCRGDKGHASCLLSRRRQLDGLDRTASCCRRVYDRLSLPAGRVLWVLVRRPRHVHVVSQDGQGGRAQLNKVRLSGHSRCRPTVIQRVERGGQS